MFSLIYGLVEYLLRKDEFHILILGLDKAGKTNLLEKLKTLYTDMLGMEPSKILPTVGLNVGRMEAFKSNLVLWDLGGQPGLRSIWDKYFDETHALVYVVDASDRERFEESKRALDKVLGSRQLFGAPLLILANKQDAPGAAGVAEMQEQFGIGKLDTRPVKVQPASAYTAQGIADGLSWLVGVTKRSARVAMLRSKK